MTDDPSFAAATRFTARDPLTPELIITGIPRSGTSYLCNILHRMSNCVILNEPSETVQILTSASPAAGLADFLRDRRRDVIAGTAISNKLDGGQVTQDTAQSNETRLYTPRVDSPNFVLGVKETLAFLSRLPWLRSALPEARFVACVRNPFDTIASWKGSFRHLKFAEVVRQPVGNPIDPCLTQRQRDELRSIAGILDPALRRAAWWRYLASLVLQSRDFLILIRYEDLVARPAQMMQKILDGWPAGVLTQRIEPSAVRRRTQLLTPQDRSAIGSLCRDSACALGLDPEP